MKDALASREKNVENLKNELFKVAQEKDKEVKLALESMAKLEAEVALEKKKVEVAEAKLAACLEDHRYIFPYSHQAVMTQTSFQTSPGQLECKL